MGVYVVWVTGVLRTRYRIARAGGREGGLQTAVLCCLLMHVALCVAYAAAACCVRWRAHEQQLIW
jgi:hypothetical protein